MSAELNDFLAGVERAHKAKDIASLQKLAVQAGNTASRSFQLLGDLYRLNGQLEPAVEAYQQCAPGNMSAIYGLIECWKGLDDHAHFCQAVDRLIALKRDNPPIFSRVALAAAEFGEDRVAKTLLDKLDETPAQTTDARHAFRCAKAFVLLGDKERARRYGEQARLHAGEDENLILGLRTLDYRLEEYWEARYTSSQGERTPVPVADQSDELYRIRRERDLAFLERVFDKVFGEVRFATAADCGCGSGRLTPFIVSRADTVESFDISPTAIEHAKKNNPQLANVAFQAANLAETALPAEAYDLVFDFTAVQHVADKDQWHSVLENYARAVKPGGHLFLVEYGGNDTDRHVFHVNNASAETYIATVEALGFALVHRETTPTPDNPTEECFVFQKKPSEAA